MSLSKKSKTLIFTILRISVVLAGIAWAVVWLNKEERWQNLVETFGKVNIWVFCLTLLVYVLAQFVVALRWWLLLKSQKITIKISAAFKLHFFGLFYNNFMPGSVGGDFIRAWYVTRHTEKKFLAALSVFVDRIIGFASTLVVAAFFYFTYLRSRAQGSILSGVEQNRVWDNICSYRGQILIAIAGLCVLFALLFLIPRTRKVFVRIANSLKTHIKSLLAKFIDAFLLYGRQPKTIIAVLILSIISQMGSITPYWLLGQSMGIDIGLRYYYVFFTLTWVIGGIPVSVGGAVVTEGLLALFFIKIAGVQPEPAFALALCQRIIWMMASIPGAVIHIAGAHLPKRFTIDQPEDID
jgi:hypothetical protein